MEFLQIRAKRGIGMEDIILKLKYESTDLKEMKNFLELLVKLSKQAIDRNAEIIRDIEKSI